MYNGERIKEIMKLKNISNKKMVEDLGWASHRQVYQIINGNPTASTLTLLAEYLGVSVSCFFDSDLDAVLEDTKPSDIPNWDLISALLHAKEETIRIQAQRISDLERIIQMLDNGTSQGQNK